MKLRQIQNYMSIDGEIPKGTYIVEGELKIVRFYQKNNFFAQEIYRTYHNGETVNLKEHGRYYCVCYEKIDTFKNIKFLNSYLHKSGRQKKLQFLSCHYKFLRDFILKEHNERFYLDWIFKLREEPDRLEIWKGDKHILKIGEESLEYKQSPQVYKLVSYIP